MDVISQIVNRGRQLGIKYQKKKKISASVLKFLFNRLDWKLFLMNVIVNRQRYLLRVEYQKQKKKCLCLCSQISVHPRGLPKNLI